MATLADGPPGAVDINAGPPGAVDISAGPPGATNIGEPETYDIPAIKKLWLKNGGNPQAADIMSHVVFNESAGNPHQVNPESGAAGLYQINPKAHGQGNWTDPDTATKKAIELYGKFGLQPWEDSKTKGAEGGWGKYLTPGTTAPGTPSNNTPLPLAPKGVNKKMNEDPRRGNYSIFESLAGHQELPFMLSNAALMDSLEASGKYHMGGGYDKKTGSHVDEVMRLWTAKAFGGSGSPGAASAIYGLNNPEVLKAYKAAGGPFEAYANMLGDNAWLKGGATFLEEWFNPLSWVEGGAAGKGLGLTVRGLKLIPGVDGVMTNLVHALSAYRPIVAAHGTGPRNVLAAIGQRMSASDSKAHDAMMDVFAGMNEPEQLEIVRRQQGLAPSNAFSAARSAIIDQRAALKRAYTRDMTAQKLATGAIKKDQVHGVKGSAPTTITHNGQSWDFDYDPGTYHGLKDQYTHPNAPYREQANSASSIFAGPSTRSKTYDNIDEAMHGPGPDASQLRSDIDHAALFKNFMSTGGKRGEFEKGMRELAERHPDVITHPTSMEERNRLIATGKYIPVSDRKFSGIDLSGDKGSPFMQGALISPAFRDFLTHKNSMSTLLGSSLAERGQGTPWEKWYNGFNQAFRAMIVANPVFHPFWNVAPNSAAAIGRQGPQGLGAMMAAHMKAILGAAATVSSLAGPPGKALGRVLDTGREMIPMQRAFLKGAEKWQDDLHTALDAGHDAKVAGAVPFAERPSHFGAGAEFGGPRTAWGGSVGKIFTRPRDAATGKLKAMWDNPAEAFDRMLSRAGQWNQEATFGARGEKAFSDTLFHRLYSKGGLHEGDPYAAAWAVREALGNYRNLDPENWMSKHILFFPWLASNVPHWFKALTKTPSFVTAPVQASRTQRESADDPTAYRSDYPRLGISAYTGSDDTTGDVAHHDFPEPSKDVGRLVQAGYSALTGDVPGAIKGAAGELASRAKPLQGAAMDTALTTYDQKANPAGSYEGYNTMFNKNLPETVPQQLAGSLALELTPFPAPFVTRNILRNGWDPTKVPQYLEEAAGAGYLSSHEADSFKHASSHLDQKLEQGMIKLRKAAKSPHPPSEDKLKAISHKLQDDYLKHSSDLKARVDALKKKRGAPPDAPPGSVDINAGPPGATNL